MENWDVAEGGEHVSTAPCPHPALSRSGENVLGAWAEEAAPDSTAESSVSGACPEALQGRRGSLSLAPTPRLLPPLAPHCPADNASVTVLSVRTELQMARPGLATSLEPPLLSSLSGLSASCSFQILSLCFPFKQCFMEYLKNSTTGRFPPLYS